MHDASAELVLAVGGAEDRDRAGMQDALDVDSRLSAGSGKMGGVKRGVGNQGSECLLVTAETVRPALYRSGLERYTGAAGGTAMRTTVLVVLVAVVLLGGSAMPAHASAAVDAALALGAFAVFNQLFVLPFVRPVYAAPPPVVYSAPPAVYAAPPPAPPAIRREVVYPNGRHVLLGDGVTVAYQWVWVPNPPAGPPPPPPGR
jgi:hypothetical protein